MKRLFSIETIRKGLHSQSVWVLVGVNLIPVFGVFVFDWNISSIIQLYYLENIVYIVYFFLKLMKVFSANPGVTYDMIGEVEPGSGVSRILIAFYLIFVLIATMALYGPFVFGIFGPLAFSSLASFSIFIGGLFFSHGFSYIRNFIGKMEYTYTTPKQIFLIPFKRAIVIHIAIIFGAIFLKYNWIVLIFLKIVADVITHINEHKNSSGVPTPPMVVN